MTPEDVEGPSGVVTRAGRDAASYRQEVAWLEQTQQATLNILEDFDREKAQAEKTQRATFNILEDFEVEKARLGETLQATFNILEDFEVEKARQEETQQATLNILEDFETEKDHLEDAQRASLNILEDLDLEKKRVEQTEHELAVRAEELSRANADLEAFAYSVSHDLRAPLRSMDGFSRMLLEEPASLLSPDGRHYVDMILESAGEMGALVDDLLRFSRLGKQAIHREATDVRRLAAQVLEELRPQYAARNVRIRVADVPPCQADPSLLHQVYTNLLSNAIKYTRRCATAEIEVGWDPADGGVYYVKDNGVGFDMRHAKKLFGVFQRLHRAEEYEGTGVGLAIVQRIVTRHGGRIWAEAEVDRGATFRFTMPGGTEHG